jgi:hypothetical protein
MHAADADQIIQFLFPPERLPAHTQVRLGMGRVVLVVVWGFVWVCAGLQVFAWYCPLLCLILVLSKPAGTTLSHAWGCCPCAPCCCTCVTITSVCPGCCYPQQELLRVPSGRKELDGWPQYRGRLRLDNMGRCQVGHMWGLVGGLVQLLGSTVARQAV